MCIQQVALWRYVFNMTFKKSLFIFFFVKAEMPENVLIAASQI